MDTVSGITQAFPCHHANQAATLRDLERLRTNYGYPLHHIDSDCGSHFKGHDVQEWIKEHDIERRFHLPCNPQATGLVERKNEILRQQIKLLIGKLTLAEWTQVLFQALIRLNDQPVGPVAPYAKTEGPC